MFDIVFRGGLVIDGSGNPAFRGDVAVAGGAISLVADEIRLPAKQVLDVGGCIVAPGFVDLHSHGDYGILRFSHGENLLRQGCTTAVVGNCGVSLAPLPPSSLAAIVSQFPFVPREDRERGHFPWTTFGEYLGRVEDAELGINIGALVGHGALRTIVMGTEAQAAGDADVDQMSRLMEQCFDDGSIGMSTGLIYPPGIYSTTSELVGLCRTIARRKRLYATHIRSEADRLLEAIAEALLLAERTGVRVHISHLKAVGPANWGKVPQALDAIEQARGRGCDISCDAYPYLAGCTTLAALLPPWVGSADTRALREKLGEEGVRRGVTEDLQRKQDKWDNLYRSVGPENISIAACPTHPGLEAKSLSDVAHQDGKPPIETLLDLLAEDPEGVLVVLHEMSQDDVARAICHPLCAICSDGDIRVPIGSEHLHPRTYGAFTRALIGARDGIYPVAMEEMIRKMTSFPAERIGVWNRGRVQEGMAGDLVVFSPADLREGCSYDTPNECAVGVRFVTVNGQLVLSDGELTTARPGQVIRQT